jgi:fibro-slime domain-containing protein
MKRFLAGLVGTCVAAWMATGCSCSSSGASAGDGGPNSQRDGIGLYVPRDGESPVTESDGGECQGIVATIRDFTPATNMDFENGSGQGATTGLVQEMLDAEHKPVYAHGTDTVGAIHGAGSYNQWYRDVANVNMPFQVPLPLSPSGNAFVFDDSTFFPIDGRGFGSMHEGRDGQMHNFHFTTEVHTSFTYHRGQSFTFRGDDDLWIFVDRKLALDLGGLHERLEGTIDMDYALDIFHAERHTIDSNFRIETTIDCFQPPLG